MYAAIMVPVDLSHIDRLDKALTSAADLAKHYGAAITVVGVTAAAPGTVAHNPAEYAAKLQAFADALAAEHGVPVTAAAYTSHDPTRDLDKTLLAAAKEQGTDLIVMASHVPGLPEHIFTSHGGGVAAHAPVSVFVVR